MRLRRLAVLVFAVPALAACTGPSSRQMAAPIVRSDLEALMYGPPPGAPAVVQHAIPVMPVRAVLPEGDGPYTLDTGDKLRIVVFGQDNLSNTYAVDAAGQVTMPLIGAVTARDLTPAALTATIKSRLASGFIREPSVAVEVETYRSFFVL